jgi:tRNA threonylcarbamoyladenosine biosynthesis protein TsaE
MAFSSQQEQKMEQKPRKIITNSPQKTQTAGKALALSVLKEKNRKTAFVLALVGDLGGGKTTFLQGFAKGLGLKQKITSPTFIIMRRLDNFYHLDCYRLAKTKDLLALGFKELVANPKNIIAIEWADKVREALPKNTVFLHFKFIDDKKREIVLK